MSAPTPARTSSGRRPWRRGGSLALAAGALGALALLTSGCSAPTVLAACGRRLVASASPALVDPALVEISGIAASRTTAGVWWVHNDSGDTARVFALDDTGAVRATLTLPGVTAIDFEDLAVGEGPIAGVNHLYVGDIGDNAAVRPEILVHRMVEPSVPLTGSTTGTVTGVETLRLAYPDGPHDAEALAIDPVSHSILVITKSLAGGAQTVYRASTATAPGATVTMTVAGTVTTTTGLAGAITGADLTRDGLQLAVRTYGGVRVVARNADLPLDRFVAGATGSVSCTGPVPAEIQGEAIGFRADGRGYVTVSEGAGAVLHRYTAP
ncbi:MAG: hypothetical protein ACKO72_09480 [Actinomycetes bacterium]